jgi:hypothetical protein
MPEIEQCAVCGKLVLGEQITIPKAEYLTLKEGYLAFQNSQDRFKKYQGYSRSPIAQNNELAEFILDCQKTMTLYQIKDACREKFNGIGPSKSAIYRFLRAVQSPFEGHLRTV